MAPPQHTYMHLLFPELEGCVRLHPLLMSVPYDEYVCASTPLAALTKCQFKCHCPSCSGEDASLPKEQMKELHEVLTSSFFKSVKEVMELYLLNCSGLCLSRDLWDLEGTTWV